MAENTRPSPEGGHEIFEKLCVDLLDCVVRMHLAGLVQAMYQVPREDPRFPARILNTMVPAMHDDVSGMLYQIDIQFAEGRRADIEFIVAFEGEALVGASVEKFNDEDLDYEILAAAYVVG